MTLSLADVMTVDGGGTLLRNRRKAHETEPPPFSLSRRRFLEGAFTLASAAAIYSLSWIPTARPAWADHGEWKIWGSCSGLGDWVLDDNCRGCNQGSVICCCGDNGFHLYEGCRYRHRPDQCKDDPDSPNDYDGWLWKYGGCCPVACGVCHLDVEWRCSDGYTRADCEAPWDTSICRVRVDKGGGCNCGTC